jgi:hypothetical protein
MKTLGIIREMLKKPASEIIYRKYAIKTTMYAKILRPPRGVSILLNQSLLEIRCAAASWFESGFTGFRGLTITSLLGWEGYY